MKLKKKHSRKSCQELLLILVSLGLGILIWFLVVGADQMDMTVTVPIEILNLPKKLFIYNQYQKEVEVTLRGPRTIMQEMRSRNLSLPVDLSQAAPDTVVISTNSLPLQLPSGIAVLRMQPASITLSIDEPVEKHISVEAVTKGKVAPGYVLKNISINPDKILVSGPQSLLAEQETLKTNPIDLEGRSKSETLPVSLNLSSELMSLIGETNVAAKIIVQEKFVEKIIYNIPIKVSNTELPLVLKPDTVSVFASLPERLTAHSQNLPLLFTASVQLEGNVLPHTVPVEVSSVTVADHEPIEIKSFTPQEVEIISLGNDAQQESVSPVIKPTAKKEEQKNKQDAH